MRRPAPTLHAALVLALPALLVAGGTAAQETSLRTTRSVDDISGRADTRLIIMSDSLPPLRHNGSAGEYKGATIVIACGNRVPGDSGRTLMLYAGQAMDTFGEGLGYAEIVMDAEPKPRKLDLALLPGHQAGFLGADRRPYYSEEILRALLSASEVRARIRVIGGEWRSATFRPAGLRQALQGIRGCRWPLD